MEPIMKRWTLAGAGLGLALTTMAATRMGGWAVVTVESVPDYLVVGRPVTLSFMVRQHAVTVLSDLSPTVTATSGARQIVARTVRATGGYRADFTVPEPGDWQIKIASGFGRSGGTLLPLRAIDAGARAPAPLSDTERGRVLFAAKGCVTCHMHGDVGIKGELSDLGPELTTRRFAAAYLTQFLTDPTIKPAENGKGQMPRPDLRQGDFAPLIAFINSERKTAVR
jgi:mono/diheme cytochrome c family protein